MNLYNRRGVWHSNLRARVCAAGSTVACLAFTVTSHFDKQALMHLQSYGKRSAVITGM